MPRLKKYTKDVPQGRVHITARFGTVVKLNDTARNLLGERRNMTVVIDDSVLCMKLNAQGATKLSQAGLNVPIKKDQLIALGRPEIDEPFRIYPLRDETGKVVELCAQPEGGEG